MALIKDFLDIVFDIVSYDFGLNAVRYEKRFRLFGNYIFFK
jgi:hypothetical protein